MLKYLNENRYMNLQDELESKWPDIMKLGLLHETDIKVVTTPGQPSFVSFGCKSFQELAAAFHIERLLWRSLYTWVRSKHH